MQSLTCGRYAGSVLSSAEDWSQRRRVGPRRKIPKTRDYSTALKIKISRTRSLSGLQCERSLRQTAPNSTVVFKEMAPPIVQYTIEYTNFRVWLGSIPNPKSKHESQDYPGLSIRAYIGSVISGSLSSGVEAAAVLARARRRGKQDPFQNDSCMCMWMDGPVVAC